MPLLHEHPVLLLRDAVQLTAITERMISKISKDRPKFFI